MRWKKSHFHLGDLFNFYIISQVLDAFASLYRIVIDEQFKVDSLSDPRKIYREINKVTTSLEIKKEHIMPWLTLSQNDVVPQATKSKKPRHEIEFWSRIGETTGGTLKTSGTKQWGKRGCLLLKLVKEPSFCWTRIYL